jgi:hypothetical protein
MVAKKRKLLRGQGRVPLFSEGLVSVLPSGSSTLHYCPANHDKSTGATASESLCSQAKPKRNDSGYTYRCEVKYRHKYPATLFYMARIANPNRLQQRNEKAEAYIFNFYLRKNITILLVDRQILLPKEMDGTRTVLSPTYFPLYFV